MAGRNPKLAAAFAAILIAAASSAAPLSSNLPPNRQPEPSARPSPEEAAARAKVREEADRLLVDAATAEQRVTVEAALREGPGSPLAIEILARMADGRILPPWISDAAASASALWPESDPRPITRALVGARTLGAARALVALSIRWKGSPRSGTFDALIEVTGRDDVRADPEAWSNLLKTTEGWTEERWLRTIASWQADRSKRLANEQQQTSVRLQETLKQVHLATPVAERSRLIATLLNDPLNDVRRVGIDLALRELASANPLGPDVSSGAVRLVSDPDESVRAAAAGLLLQLSPAGSADIAVSALSRERSPRVATPLLKLAVRSSDSAAVAQAISWLEDPRRGSERFAPGADAVRACRDAAVDLAWQLVRRGIMNDEADRVRVLAALRAIPLNELSPGGCQLRGTLGTGMDVDQVATLLKSTDAAQRLAAAETVVAYPEHLDEVVSAAKDDARLVEVAVRGVQMHRQTADGFIAIERATEGKPEQRRSALSAVADVLPSPEILTAIESLNAEPEMKEAVLATLTRRERINSERADSQKARAIADGLIRLARLRLRLNKPAEAIAALDMLKSVETDADQSEVRRLRITSFIRLGRIADATDCGPDAEGWLEGLTAVIDKPFARDVVEAMDAVVSGTMNEEQFATLELLRRRLPPKKAPVVAEQPDEGSSSARR